MRMPEPPRWMMDLALMAGIFSIAIRPFGPIFYTMEVD